MSIPLTDAESERLLVFLEAALDASLTFDLPPQVLAGGFDNRVFHLRLQNSILTNDLVLRLYRPTPDASDRARMEAIVQNCLADNGYPAPRVHVTCIESGVLGSPFILMDHVEGEQLLSVAEPRASEIMGEIHAQLHEVNPVPLREALRSEGLGTHGLQDRFSVVRGIIANHAFLQEVFEWLITKAPVEDAISICHGDFHKLNVLVTYDAVTGVVDWSNFSLMDPAFDVVATTISFSVISKHLVEAGLFEVANLEQVVEVYHSAYSSIRTLNRKNWDYYWVLRSFLILFFADRGAVVFRHPGILAELAQDIERISGIQVTPPQY